MMLLSCVTFLLLTLAAISYGENPGAKILITEQGLKKGVEYLLGKMMSNNTVYQLPDVSGSENIASEDMKYEFTQIRLVKFHHGTLRTQWVPETGMQVSMENADATINCKWKIDSWFIKDSGDGVLTLSGVSVSMMMGVRRIDPGVPSIYLLDCQSNIQNVDIQMLGGVRYVYESLKQPLQDVVRGTVNQQLCSALRSQVKKWDGSASKLQLNVTLNPLVNLDLSLVGNPEISDRYACLGLKGSKVLTTLDLATYMPEISQHSPNSVPVKIHMYATRTPLVFLHLNNMTVQFAGSLHAYTYTSQSKTEKLFSVNLVASFQTNIFLSEARGARGLNLTASMILNRLETEGSQPTTGEEKSQVKVTENGVLQLFRRLLIPTINEDLSRGIFISSSFLKNATVVMEQGFAILAADIQ